MGWGPGYGQIRDVSLSPVDCWSSFVLLKSEYYMEKQVNSEGEMGQEVVQNLGLCSGSQLDTEVREKSLK